LNRKNDFAINVDSIITAMAGCGMVFLCNPNNPTGGILHREAVLAIAEAAERMSCYLVVDEAFIDFTPEYSVLDQVANNSYLIVLRSLTKFYALSGLRIGYGVFPKALAASVKNYKEPWTINSLAQKAGIAAVSDKAYQQKTMTVIYEEKRFLERGLKNIGIEYFPSAANYYLLRAKNAREIVITLRRKGILLRDCSNFSGLDGSYLRIAVRSREENKRLLKEMGVLCSV
jgi:threonine-phosphate decarboxylase